jgi:hypothetical protein
MFSSRHVLLCTFAGGCLSGVVLISVWPESRPTLSESRPPARTVVRSEEPAFSPPVEDANPVEDVADDEQVENESAASPSAPAESEREPPTETGLSIADIILHMEAAYRLGLAASRQPAASPAPVPAREPPAHEAPVVAAAAPTAAALPAVPPPAERTVDSRSLVASRGDAQPREIHIAGDLRQNTNVGTVNEGPVVMVQEVVQYVPYFPYVPAGVVAPPAYGPRPLTPRSPVPSVHFRSPPLTLDGPFKYPVDLVH